MEMPEDQFALYAEFSITAEKAQVLENEAGNVFIYYRALFVNTDEITPVEEVNRKPLGVLLKNMGTSSFRCNDYRCRRRRAQEQELPHSSLFRTHNFALFSEDGRKLMIADLKNIQAKLDKTDAMLRAVCGILIKIGGWEEISHEKALRFQSKGRSALLNV